MPRFSELSFEVQGMLDGINRYNPQNLDMLEDYVSVQVSENQYDLEANLTVLKLYQLNNDLYKVDIVAKILLKCIMQLPKTDLTLAKCLIDHSKCEQEPIKTILEFSGLLETCQFDQVWKELHARPETFHDAKGFADAIRDFACHVVKIAYQNIKKEVLIALLGEPSDQALAAICSKYGWQLQPDGYVHVSNMEDSIKSRNIEETIDFQCVQDIMRAAA